jgi:hypothetical protein
MKCRIDDCEKGGKLRRGWCVMHYKRWERNGDPLLTTRAPHGTSFIDKVDRFLDGRPEGECWPWRGVRTMHGYGSVTLDGRAVVAHRASYETFVGPIPEGLEIDHLCRVRECVNPEHLEPVTHEVNMQRAHAV